MVVPIPSWERTFDLPFAKKMSAATPVSSVAALLSRDVQVCGLRLFNPAI